MIEAVFESPLGDLRHDDLKREFLQGYAKELNAKSHLYEGIADLLHLLDVNSHSMGGCHQQTQHLRPSHFGAF